jgi:hypothetical protein
MDGKKKTNHAAANEGPKVAIKRRKKKKYNVFFPTPILCSIGPFTVYIPPGCQIVPVQSFGV